MRRHADAWALAEEQKCRIGSADSRRRDMPLRSIAAQIGVETHVNDRTVQTKMHDAWRLVTGFAATVTALEEGRISKAHADVILDAGDRLGAEVRAAFETVVLDWAAGETVGRTRAYARQLAERLDPRDIADRHAEAAADRTVTVVDLDNGMSQIIALVPTVYAHAVVDRITRQGKAIQKTSLAARRHARERQWAAAAATQRHADGAGDDGDGPDASADECAGMDAAGAARATNTADAAGARGETDAPNAASGRGEADTPNAADAAGARGEAGAPNTAEATGAGDGSNAAVSGVDDRTLDQIRADLFVDMLLTGAPAIDPTAECGGGLGAIRAQVQITMPITTLTGITQGGAEIDGKAPIDPDTARRLAGDTRVWDRVMHDPVTAVVITVDRYTPTPAQQRFLHARDRRCRFPGCRMPARRCQIDHTHEHHDGGTTSIDNLACLRLSRESGGGSVCLRRVYAWSGG